ncbi:BQ2448_7555 [Microbotryum intermedium]|uniref:BQ2448_7555 protein n=1 Tax=Microbotryum intermedium TaxID=269621 RepID=A0A238FTX3_9BASI|nr:BQ2448_7555 [Microbotryum intermedium]
MPARRTLKPAIAIHTTTATSSAGGSGSASSSVGGGGGGGGAASIGHAHATSRSRTPSVSVLATLHPNRAKSIPLSHSRDITPEFGYDLSRHDSHDQLDSDDTSGHSPVFNQYGPGASSSSSSLLMNSSTSGLNPQQLRSLARKERNRMAAQKSRDRKKDEFEGLSAENDALREEIRALKDRVQKLENELSTYRGVGVSKPTSSRAQGSTAGQGLAKKRRVKGASPTPNEPAEMTSKRGFGIAPDASVPMVKVDSRRSMASTSTGFTSLDDLAFRRDEEMEEEEEEEEYEYDDGHETETERDEAVERGLMLDEALLRIISEQDIIKDEDEEEGEEDEEIMNIARVMGTMREAASDPVRPVMFRRRSSIRASTAATPNVASAADSGSTSAESSLPLSPKRKRKGSAASIQGNSRTLFPAIASVLVSGSWPFSACIGRY